MLSNMSKSNVSTYMSRMDALIAAPVVPDTFTENGCAAFSTTGSSCLDFFTSVVRNTPPSVVITKFRAACLENKHLALQILMNLRDRDGKQEKSVSFAAFNYLKTIAPRTYLKNLPGFIEIGCWKDALVLAGMGDHSLVKTPELELMAAQLADDAAALVAPSGGASASASSGASAAVARVSLAGKWAPTEGCHFDKKIKAAHKIAGFLGKKMPEYRKMLTALRTKLDVLEQKQSLNKWGEINFSHVPATAMKKQSKAFKEHLPEKFTAYLAAVMAGKAKMNTKGVQPHELVRHYLDRKHIDPAIDAQWKAMVDRLAAAGTFKDAVAICDVSGSMSGVPMEVSIALGLMVSELTAAPFKGRLITFSETPAWHAVTGSTLAEKVFSISQAAWGMSTNFIAVFEMLLREAQTYGLTPAQMIKKVFVFTDMQFNEASNASYATAFDVIKAKYAAAGYTLPQIVFWNLRETSVSFPVQKDAPGVAMMSGFSGEMLKLFLDEIEMTPYTMMLRAVSKYRVFVMDETAASSASVSAAVATTATAASAHSLSVNATASAGGGAGVNSSSSTTVAAKASGGAGVDSSSSTTVAATSAVGGAGVNSSSSTTAASATTAVVTPDPGVIASLQAQLASLQSVLSSMIGRPV